MSGGSFCFEGSGGLIPVMCGHCLLFKPLAGAQTYVKQRPFGLPSEVLDQYLHGLGVQACCVASSTPRPALARNLHEAFQPKLASPPNGLIHGSVARCCRHSLVQDSWADQSFRQSGTNCPEGPSVQTWRDKVPKTIVGILFGT